MDVCANLFDYLCRELGLSRGSAHYRKVAARLVQQHPELEAPLRDGRLCFSSIVELSKVITPQNAAEVLPRFLHVSKQGAKAVVAELHPDPAPPLRTVVTAVPGAAVPVAVRRVQPVELDLPAPARPAEGMLRTAVQPVELPSPVPIQAVDSQLPARAQPVEPALTVPPAPFIPAAPPRDLIEPVTGDLRRVHLTVPKRLLEKLEEARAALSHSHPGAEAADILEAGLDLILLQRDKRRGTGRKPAAKPRPAKPDHITAEVRREVWARDQGRCQFPLASGGICGSTQRLELDHIHPKALGGGATASDLRVACDVHNQHAARLVFGDAFMDRRIRERRERKKRANDGETARPSPCPARPSTL